MFVDNLLNKLNQICMKFYAKKVINFIKLNLNIYKFIGIQKKKYIIFIYIYSLFIFILNILKTLY